jgi:hypothetical protein
VLDDLPCEVVGTEYVLVKLTTVDCIGAFEPCGAAECPACIQADVVRVP